MDILPPYISHRRAAARRRAARRRAIRRFVAGTIAVPVIAVLAVTALSARSGRAGPTTDRDTATTSPGSPNPPKLAAAGAAPLAPLDIYAGDAAGDLSPAVRGDPALVYVPNSMSNTLSVISQRTMSVIATYPVGALPQHVTPAYDLRTLYVDNDLGNTLTPIDPATGRPSGAPIPVEDPYNLYFTPDGRFAIVVAERLQRLDFRTPTTFRLVHSLYIPACRGIDHADFSADGRYMFASCEFAGRMVEVDLKTQRVVRTLVVGGGNASPQDVKISPDGRTLYAADQLSGGLWEIAPQTFRVIGFLPTGAGAHGLYPSRNAKVMYVSNRQAGSVSVVSFATRRVIRTWPLPQPASPDMGGVSVDGHVLWLSGRYSSTVYAIDTGNGHLIASIPVGAGPHGLCVWPQPGSYSLGHTGVLR
jgi:YVTN family beta-propeller protein